MGTLITYEFLFVDGRVTPGRSEFPCQGIESPEWFLHLRNLWRELAGDSVLERVNVFHDGRYTDMLVDECGRLKRLALNSKATVIYRNNVQVHEPNPPPPRTMPAIYGPALLFHQKVWF